jgi:hypothetical protein
MTAALMKRRTFLRASLLEYICVGLIFLLLACFYTNFVVFHITHQLFIDGPGDATAGFLWLNFADPGINPFLAETTLVNYPSGEKLGSATFVTYLALWLPIRLFSYLFGAVAGLNIMMLCGLIGGAMGGYWLVKRLTGSVAVSFFAGLAIAFVPYNLYKSSVHLAYIFALVFILMLAAFIAVWMRPTRFKAILFGSSIALAFYTDGYYLLLASVMTMGLIVAGVLHGYVSKFRWIDYRQRIVALIVSLCSLLLLMIPISYVQLTQGSNVQNTLSSSRSNISDELRAYQTRLTDFILPSPTNPLFELTGQAQTLDTYKNLHSNRTESMVYIGFTVIILVTIGLILSLVWVVRRKYSSLGAVQEHVRNKYILLACIVVITVPLFLSFMLSPSITLFHHVIYLPGQFFINHNIALWRVMARFFVPLHVVLVIFASFSLWMILRVSKTLQHRKILEIIIVLIAIILVMAEYATGNYRPSFDFRNAPESYQWLSRQESIKTIAEFPMVDPLDAHTTRYVTYQIVHGKNLVNFKEPSAQRLTNTLGSINNPEAIDFAYERGAQAIVTHDIDCLTNISWGVLIHSGNDMPSGKICIYKLNSPISNDQLFAVYGEGFKYYPNSLHPEYSLASFDGRQAELRITDALFKPETVRVSAHVVAQIRDFHNNRVSGAWAVKQSGETVSSGRIEASSGEVDAIVDATKQVTIELTPDSGVLLRPDDLSLNGMVVTAAP